jgi:hypothetical protein
MMRILNPEHEHYYTGKFIIKVPIASCFLLSAGPYSEKGNEIIQRILNFTDAKADGVGIVDGIDLSMPIDDFILILLGGCGLTKCAARVTQGAVV